MILNVPYFLSLCSDIMFILDWPVNSEAFEAETHLMEITSMLLYSFHLHALKLVTIKKSTYFK